jgi:hypothetical protein
MAMLQLTQPKTLIYNLKEPLMELTIEYQGSTHKDMRTKLLLGSILGNKADKKDLT